jgi:hypothetical protein
MLPNGKFHKESKNVINRLLEEGEISHETYYAMVGNPGIAEEMLQQNVFAYHFLTGTIMFQSAPMEMYCKDKWRVLQASRDKSGV